MAEYKCFNCGKKVTTAELKKRFICPNCNSRIFYKPRDKVKTVSTN